MRAPQNSFFIFRKFLTSSINYQHECASISNYILINIDLKWVVLIHCHKSFQSVAANNRVTCKSKLYLVACRLMNYSRVGIFYFWMNRETHALSWTKEFFSDLYSKIYLWPDLSSPNGVFERHNLDHMGVFMPTRSCGINISWYFSFQNINIK